MNQGLTDAELAQIRADVESLLPDTCDILSKTETIDSAGGFTTTWAASAEDVICRMDYKSGVEQLAGGGLRSFTRMEFYVPYDTTVTTENRIRWNGEDYTIESVNGNSWMGMKYMEVNGAE